MAPRARAREGTGQTWTSLPVMPRVRAPARSVSVKGDGADMDVSGEPRVPAPASSVKISHR